MTGKPIHLLKRLEPSIRPAYAGAKGSVSKPPLETQSFDSLLALVADGSMHSDRPVTMAFETEDELTQEQLERLASASDQAESAGAKRALMLIDGRGLVLDVAPRQLVAELSGQADESVVSIDAAIFVPGESDESTTSNTTLKLPGDGLVPRSVALQIERAYEERQAQTPIQNSNQEPSRRRQAG